MMSDEQVDDDDRHAMERVQETYLAEFAWWSSFQRRMAGSFNVCS